MKKMTMKNTVAEIKMALTNASKTKAVKANKNLIERLVYTSNALKKGEKVGKKDLLDLATECFSTIEAYAEEQKKPAKQTAKPKGEASVKKAPAKKAPAKKSEPKKEEPKKAPKKSAKAAPKKPEKKKAPAKEEPKSVFPKSFEDEDYSYDRADDLVDMASVRNSMENDEELVIAALWTKDDLKKFTYCNGHVRKPKSFDNDLDLLTVVYVGDNADVIYAVSMYTEALFVFHGKSLKMKKDGSRVENALPYSVYRAEEK